MASHQDRIEDIASEDLTVLFSGFEMLTANEFDERKREQKRAKQLTKRTARLRRFAKRKIEKKSRTTQERVIHLVLWLSFAIGVMYALNASIIYFGQPGNIQQGEAVAEYATVDGIQIAGFDDLYSGGVNIFGLNYPSMGYVNMMSPDQMIYVNYSSENMSGGNALYQHERAHVLQKNMIAEASGGYPSYSNPIRSFIYYGNLMRLNHDLREHMPKTDALGTSWITDGLESAGDCFAQPYSSQHSDPVFYRAPYLGDEHCTSSQRAIALQLQFPDEWITDLTQEERNQLPEENIISTIAGIPVSGKDAGSVKFAYSSKNASQKHQRMSVSEIAENIRQKYSDHSATQP